MAAAGWDAEANGPSDGDTYTVSPRRPAPAPKVVHNRIAARCIPTQPRENMLIANDLHILITTGVIMKLSLVVNLLFTLSCEGMKAADRVEVEIVT